MRHDPELIRQILDHVACGSGNLNAAAILMAGAHSPDAVERHVALLIEHKLLDGTSQIVHGLTEKGHAMRRALHDKNVRAKIKHAGEHLGEDVTIEIILDIAKTVLLGL